MTAPEDLPGCDSLNINISAYRVLYLLLLLVQYRSLSATELNRFLYENPLIQRTYNNETLTKYINTLREVGCVIPRSSNRNEYCYELLKTPFPLGLDPQEQAVAERLLHLLSHQPDEVLATNFRDFLTQLAWGIEPSPTAWQADQPALPAAGSSDLPAPDLFQRRQLLNRFRDYCRQAFILAVLVQSHGNQLQELHVEPHEVLAQGKRFMLLGTDARSHQSVTLDIERIRTAHQLPCKNKRPRNRLSVTFALYGRLSRSYRLYAGEKIVYRNPEELHIKTKVAEPTALIQRLLKYGPACQVLSPLSVRQQMRQKVDRLLAALNTE